MTLSVSESELEVLALISKDVKASTLIIFWQFILKGLEELSIVSNPILSLEMLIIRLIHLKDMPTYEGVLETLDSKNLDEVSENATGKIEKTSNLNEKNETEEIYYCDICLEGRVICKGEGSSKRKAEQDVSKKALIHYNVLT